MTSDILTEYLSEDDVLYPVTPARLAFLTRNVLLDVSPAMVSVNELYSEIWGRRAELVAGIEENMEDFKRRYARSQNEVDAREALMIIATALFGASLWFLATGLVEGFEKWMTSGHTSLVDFSGRNG